MMKREEKHGKRGIALPIVLITLALFSAVALSLLRRGTADYKHAKALQQTLRVRHLLEAGLQRGLLALVSAQDPLAAELKSNRPVLLEYHGLTIWIDLIPESGKVDLNGSDPELLRSVALGVLGDEFGESVVSFVSQMKQRGQHIRSVTSPLPLHLRQDAIASLLHQHFTVFTGQKGVYLFSAPESILEHLPGADPMEIERLLKMKRTLKADPSLLSGRLAPFLSIQRPIYTIGATAQLASGDTIRRQITILLAADQKSYHILFQGDVAGTPSTLQ